MQNDSCVLCAIAQGKVATARILRASERAMAALNTREPQSRGHLVIFPRRHSTALHDMEREDAADVFELIRKLARALRLENYNVLHNAGALAGQTVFHAHIHLIPTTGDHEGLKFAWSTEREFDQQGWYEAVSANEL